MKYLIIVLIAYLLGSFCASIPLSKRVNGGERQRRGYEYGARLRYEGRACHLCAGCPQDCSGDARRLAPRRSCRRGACRSGLHIRALLPGVFCLPRRQGRFCRRCLGTYDGILDLCNYHGSVFCREPFNAQGIARLDVRGRLAAVCCGAHKC